MEKETELLSGINGIINVHTQATRYRLLHKDSDFFFFFFNNVVAAMFFLFFFKNEVIVA